MTPLAERGVDVAEEEEEEVMERGGRRVRVWIAGSPGFLFPFEVSETPSDVMRFTMPSSKQSLSN